MIKQYICLGSVSIFVVILLFIGSGAYADDTSSFNDQIKALHADRAQVGAQLGIDPNVDNYPHATSYYDDLVDHYEQDQLMRDVIAQGISC